MNEIQKKEITVNIKDGTFLGITVFQKIGDESVPVIICMPALGVPASYYEPLAYEIVKIRCNVVTADLRGNGLSSVKVTRSVN